MKGRERTLILFICFALTLSLASCAQGNVNKDRLPGGATDETKPGGSTQNPGGDTQDPGGNEFDDPFGLDKFGDVENNIFEDTRGYEGGGTVLFTVTSAKFYDSLADAGISEESYAASGRSKYDHYIKIDMTVKNVNVTDLEEEYTINNFQLKGHMDFFVEPVWFNLGGQANDTKRGYFRYNLPPAGETMEISIAFGLSDSILAEFRESGGIWLAYSLEAPRLQRMKLENLL